MLALTGTGAECAEEGNDSSILIVGVAVLWWQVFVEDSVCMRGSIPVCESVRMLVELRCFIMCLCIMCAKFLH